AVLPGRLKEELAAIRALLTGRSRDDGWRAGAGGSVSGAGTDGGGASGNGSGAGASGSSGGGNRGSAASAGNVSGANGGSGGAGEVHPLAKHAPWIERLLAEHGTNLSEDEAEALLREEVGRIFLRVLSDCGVFKRDEQGRAAFAAFLASLGYR